jgi:uncharacterized protein (DUF2147 family)
MRHFVALLACSLVATGAHAAGPAAPGGIWANPSNSVRVAFKPCGRDAICGTVVWASEKAKADAERGSGRDLVGTELFDHFVAEGPHRWSGQVFVPDIGQSIAGTITQTDARTLTGEGCLFGTMGCTQQTWKRVS